HNPGNEADPADCGHEDQKARRFQRAMRIEHDAKRPRCIRWRIGRYVMRSGIRTRRDRRLFRLLGFAHVLSLARGTADMKTLGKATRSAKSVGRNRRASTPARAPAMPRRTRLRKPAIAEIFR